MKFVRESVMRCEPSRLFAFHELPDAFERLLPPWENAVIEQKANISKIGSQAIVVQKIFGFFTSRWIAEHVAYDPPHMFEDIQISGPFASWRHRHIVLSHADGAVLRDEIEYEPPLGPLGALANPIFIQPKLERMFAFRHEVTRAWCESVSG